MVFVTMVDKLCSTARVNITQPIDPYRCCIKLSNSGRDTQVFVWSGQRPLHCPSPPALSNRKQVKQSNGRRGHTDSQRCTEAPLELVKLAYYGNVYRQEKIPISTI